MSLFFVLSSYLITTLLMKEKNRTGTVNIGFFYARRILRIWPLYFTMLLGLWFLGHVVTAWTVSSGTLISFLLLSGNWQLIYSTVSGPITPLWSISLEEQFYLLWPTMFLYLSNRAFLAVSVLLIPVSLITVYCLRLSGQPFYVIWWNTVPEMMFFALGAILARYSHQLFRESALGFRLLTASLAIAVGSPADLLISRGQRSSWWLVISFPLSVVFCFSRHSGRHTSLDLLFTSGK